MNESKLLVIKIIIIMNIKECLADAININKIRLDIKDNATF